MMTPVELIVKITWLSPKTLLMVSRGEDGNLEFEEISAETAALRLLVSKIREINKKVAITVDGR